MFEAGNLTLAGEFSGNKATTGGGIFSSASAALTLSDVTIAGNSALDGGGIDGAGTLLTLNVTIADNLISVGGMGGGLDVSGGSATLYNTLVAKNAVGVGTSDFTTSRVRSPR